MHYFSKYKLICLYQGGGAADWNLSGNKWRALKEEYEETVYSEFASRKLASITYDWRWLHGNHWTVSSLQRAVWGHSCANMRRLETGWVETEAPVWLFKTRLCLSWVILSERRSKVREAVMRYSKFLSSAAGIFNQTLSCYFMSWYLQIVDLNMCRVWSESISYVGCPGDFHNVCHD